MKAISTEIRTVETDRGRICFTFERKNIKNINLRIRHDGGIFVSAPDSVPQTVIDAYVTGRKDFIFNAVAGFQSQAAPQTEMQYVSGENVTFLGKNMRIKVVQDTQEYVDCDSVYVSIHVQSPDDTKQKSRLFRQWLDTQNRTVFSGIMQEVHTRFAAYHESFPELKMREMTSRWGTCQPSKNTITLNTRLIEAPKNCIEYVVFHEFCHFVHPNHSKQFYALLQVMLPDWRERKELLENCVIIEKGI